MKLLPRLSYKLTGLFCVSLIGCTGGDKDFNAVTRDGLSGAPFADFKLIKEIADHPVPLYRMEYARDVLFVRAFNSNDTEAKKLMEEKRLAVMRLYSSGTTPYPSVITNVTGCAEAFLPKSSARISTHEYILALELFANDRFSFGSCASEQIAYRVLYFQIFCAKVQKVFDVKWFLKDRMQPAMSKVIGDLKCAE